MNKSTTLSFYIRWNWLSSYTINCLFILSESDLKSKYATFIENHHKMIRLAGLGTVGLIGLILVCTLVPTLVHPSKGITYYSKVDKSNLVDRSKKPLSWMGLIQFLFYLAYKYSFSLPGCIDDMFCNRTLPACDTEGNQCVGENII